MLVHGRAQLLALAAQCLIRQLPETNGWRIDTWEMDSSNVDAAIRVYAAVLKGGAADPVVALLVGAGVDLAEILADAEHRKDDITRSDITELTAAASMIAAPGCDVDSMHMPNVPKMSRRKSESGVDIFAVTLKKTAGQDELYDEELLTVASVKHSIDKSTGGLRWKLADSLSDKELSTVYMATQLRVLNARLMQEGFTQEEASRIYLFLRSFPHPEHVELFAVGVVEPNLKQDFSHQVDLLPSVNKPGRTFRMIFFPGLAHVHNRCP